MKFKKYIILFSSLILIGCASRCHEQLYKEKSAFYSYIIGDIHNDHIVAEHAADVYTTPASCQKTITALLALKTLGADYQYETRLYVTKKQGNIQDVVITFSGDPTVTSENLVQLLRPLKSNKVNGQIILDASVFKTSVHSPNIMRDDVGTYSGRPVSSINVDRNAITVNVIPTKLGKHAKVNNDFGYRIEDSVMTTAEESSINLTWNDARHIKAQGHINPANGTLELLVSPIEFDPYIVRKIETVMKLLKIKGKIAIVRDKAKIPAKLTLINTSKSAALRDIILPALKKSDNLVFDSLYLKIIYDQNSIGIADWSEGGKVIKKLILQHFGVDIGQALFIDGSGLSRYNRVQPRQLLAILRQGYFIPEFVAALPKPGEVDSTLDKRVALPENIRAKTGFMSGISCLCGYSVSANNPKAFVIMANSFAPPAKEMSVVMDKFVSHYLGE